MGNGSSIYVGALFDDDDFTTAAATISSVLNVGLFLDFFLSIKIVHFDLMEQP